MIVGMLTCICCLREIDDEAAASYAAILKNQQNQVDEYISEIRERNGIMKIGVGRYKLNNVSFYLRECVARGLRSEVETCVEQYGTHTLQLTRPPIHPPSYLSCTAN